MAELTSFQRLKILRVFNMLYDSNSDGVIEKKDFDLLLETICDILEWQRGGDKHTNAKETLDIVWKGLEEYADTNKDSKITTDEWLKMWGECLKDLENGRFPAWQKRYMELMFDCNDKSGDDLIDLNEYTTFFSRFGISTDECKEAFTKISNGKNISKSDFEKLWREYLTSNDETSGGNFLFGPNFK